ncbi:hypothetical protein [Halobaculum sp. EA56]|uniref:hypothetical protein n=1 Tax=Halobaculum sp. EA56 TaxID=3421648 RepID=UPI003EB98975
MNRKALVGAVLMVVGVLLFLPGLGVGAGTLASAALLPAAALLVAGTYLIGTSEGGRAV